MPRSHGRKIDYEWNGSAWGVSQAAGGRTVTGLIVLAIPGTLFRCRGNAVVSIDGPTDGDKLVVAMGIMLVQSDAFAAGVTSVPDPLSDTGSDWIWHQYVPLQAQAANLEHGVVARVEIDSKAMRKFKPNQTLIMTWTGSSLAGTPAFDVTGGVRALIGT